MPAAKAPPDYAPLVEHLVASRERVRQAAQDIKELQDELRESRASYKDAVAELQKAADDLAAMRSGTYTPDLLGMAATANDPASHITLTSDPRTPAPTLPKGEMTRPAWGKPSRFKVELAGGATIQVLYTPEPLRDVIQCWGPAGTLSPSGYACWEYDHVKQPRPRATGLLEWTREWCEEQV